MNHHQMNCPMSTWKVPQKVLPRFPHQCLLCLLGLCLLVGRLPLPVEQVFFRDSAAVFEFGTFVCGGFSLDFCALGSLWRFHSFWWMRSSCLGPSFSVRNFFVPFHFPFMDAVTELTFVPWAWAFCFRALDTVVELAFIALACTLHFLAVDLVLLPWLDDRCVF